MAPMRLGPRVMRCRARRITWVSPAASAGRAPRAGRGHGRPAPGRLRAAVGGRHADPGVDGEARRRGGVPEPAQHLTHLHAVGLPAAPRPLGLDERGREVLAFVPGETVWPDRFAAVEPPDRLARVGRLVRQLHDAVAGFTPPPDAVWNVAGPRVAPVGPRPRREGVRPALGRPGLAAPRRRRAPAGARRRLRARRGAAPPARADAGAPRPRDARPAGPRPRH